MSAFFGLTQEYKLQLHEEIFSLCYHGQGGFTWNDVYNLPIHLRRFYIMKVKEMIDRKNFEVQSQAQTKPQRPTVPNFKH